MKRFLGLLLVLVMMAACHRHATETAYVPSQRLVAIDTLMQSRPDSALTLLLDSTMDDPYYQLLLSEALYKNYYDQINRSELLDAMDYFDLINDPFLSARCHYMNGVGYYEMDSLVPACAEYLKALEIMEDHFEEKELSGNKTLFVALVYSHLCELFTDQYLHVQAIEVAQKAYKYYLKRESLSWRSAWVLNQIGANYHMMEHLDSAALYYQRAIVELNDINCLIYRDISARKALLDYEMGLGCDKPLLRLKYLLAQAETDDEFFARYLAVGDILYHEKDFDTAAFYLEKAFESSNVSIKKQAAEWLVAIHRGKDELVQAIPYANYLVPFTNLNENQGFIKSQLADVYQKYVQKRKENLHKLQVKKNQKRVGLVVEVFAACFIIVALLFLLKTRQLKNERREYKIKHAALAGKLKQSYSELKKEREQYKKRETPLVNTEHATPVIHFEDEPICRHILTVCNDLKNPIKSNIAVSAYADIALTHAQEAQLKDAVNRHFVQLFEKLKALHPELKSKDFLYCCLSLLGLDNTQIAAMTQHSYRTIWEREKRLQRFFDTDDKISVVLHSFMNS